MPPFGTNSFFTISPPHPGPFLLSAVCDGYGFLAAKHEAKALGNWGNGHCLLQHPLLGWCLQLSLCQGHSSEDRTKQQLLRDGYQERKSVAWLQLGDLGDEIWHSNIPSQWFIKLADLFKLCTTAFSHGAKYRINKGLSGNSIHGKTALAVSSWQK